MSLQEQQRCFNCLAGAKGYICFEDFRKLTFDRLITVDPCEESERRSAASKEPVASDEIRSYLHSLSNDELNSILVYRKSSKRLEGGPMIFDQKPPFGQARKGFSVPIEVKSDPHREFGKGSYHNIEHPPMKDLITNAYNKDLLLEKLQTQLVEEFRRKQERIKKRDWKNKTYELRSNSISSKIHSAQPSLEGDE